MILVKDKNLLLSQREIKFKSIQKECEGIKMKIFDNFINLIKRK